VIGGKSMGGRMATMIADELGVRGVAVFGYPFHPPEQRERVRTAHLAALATPTLIVQGERDPFGTREDVAGYELAPSIEIEWMPDGDHSFVPRRGSGTSSRENFRRAIDAVAAFVTRLHR
jgi:predicted alpha/beta-hydrolase family hydrolase